MYKTPWATEEKLLKTLQKHKLLTPKVKKALTQSQKSHFKQKRDNGKPYLEEHIYTIALSLIKKYKYHKKLKDLVTVGLLHDALEDDPNFNERTCKKLFGKKITGYVKTLTKPPKKESGAFTDRAKFELNKRYIEKITESHLIVKIVKLEDRVNNTMCISNIGGNGKYKRYMQEIKEIFIPLAKTVSKHYVYELKKQVKRLEDPIG